MMQDQSNCNWRFGELVIDHIINQEEDGSGDAGSEQPDWTVSSVTPTQG
jgi:hypothetical protein